VVVKRPKGAEFVGEQKPSVSIQSKNTRFDIYPTF
jgi:16S rRNA (guanine1516-N2)-methyltransferase